MSYSFDASIGGNGEKIYSAKISGINGGIKKNLRNKIVELMKAEPTISTSKIAEILEIDRRNAEAHIRALKKSGAVKREGARKNGRWVVCEL